MSSRIIRMNNFATKKIYPHVTVGIPTYNCESYIRQAVNSVLCQSFSDFELIITDDGSTDKTLEIISEYNDPMFFYKKKKTSNYLQEKLIS